MAEADVTTHRRICPFCEQNCATLVTVDRNAGTVLGVRGDSEDPLSKGYICPKAYAVKDLHHDPDFLTGPVIKRDGKFVPVSWDEALDFTVERVRDIQSRHGKDALGAFFGTSVAHIPGLALFLGPLLGILQTRQIYSTSSIDCHPHFLVAATMTGTMNALPVPDIDRTDYLVIIGANPLQSNGSFMVAPNAPARLRAIRERGGKVVVIDPRATETAKASDWHLQVVPGGDAAMLLGVAHTLFAEGLVKLRHIESHALNLDNLRAIVELFPPERVAERCGIAAGDIRRLARELAAAERGCVYGRLGSSMQAFGTLTNWLINAVNALTGNLDREGGSMFPGGLFQPILMSEPTRDGQIPFARYGSRVSGFPEMAGQFPSALLIEEMTTAGEGQIKGLITVGTNPAISAPNGGGRFSQALADLEFMLSFDAYINETTRHADVILPSPPFLTHSDFMLFYIMFTTRDYIKYAPAVFDPAPGQLSDSEAITGLISRLGDMSEREADDFAFKVLFDQLCDQGNEVLRATTLEHVIQHVGAEPGEERMFDVLLRSGPYGDHFGIHPGGLTLAKLKEHGHGMDFGPMKPRIADVLKLSHGRMDFAPQQIIDDLPRLEAWLEAAPDKGLHLVGRRQIRSANTWTHNFPSLAKGPQLCVLLMNPADAAERSIGEGNMVRVTSRTGSVRIAASLTDDMRRGVVSLPHGWGHDEPDIPGQPLAKARAGANSNHLADERLMDLPSGNVNLNHVPVDVALD